MKKNYGLLFDAYYCVGCFACTVACRQEHGFDAETWGIKVNELVYTHPGGHVQIDYLPYPTDLCDLCGERIAKGEDDIPACQHACMTQCIEYGPIEELAKKLAQKPRAVLYNP